MGLPSSETPTIPACFMAAISAMASPLLATLAAPLGQTRTLADALARSRIPRVTEAESFTGFVFGMQQTAVKPPRAAARVPVSIVSEDSNPGSRKWQCRSIKPGATMSPVASSASLCKSLAAPLAEAGATRTMRSPSSQTSRFASMPLAGSMTRPFLIRSMCGPFGLFGFSAAGDQQEEQSHANGEPVGYLLQNARSRPIGHGGIDFQAANHGAWVEHQRARPR